jgi:hypothetical protein
MCRLSENNRLYTRTGDHVLLYGLKIYVEIKFLFNQYKMLKYENQIIHFSVLISKGNILVRLS